jgi:DNA-directed RNA polymerase specialized sigma24 family protein
MLLSAWRPHRLPAPSSAGLVAIREETTMTISTELEAQILRYYHVEKWRVGTIARQLHVHHGTVMRVLAQAGPAQNRSVAAPLPDRAVLAVYLRDPTEIPHAHRQPSIRHGA